MVGRASKRGGEFTGCAAESSELLPCVVPENNHAMNKLNHHGEEMTPMPQKVLGLQSYAQLSRSKPWVGAAMELTSV